jgi:transposase
MSGSCNSIVILKEELNRKNGRIRELESENRLLRQELAQLRTKLFGHKTKDKDKKDAKKEPKKRGAPVGHPGWFRKVPKKIDKTVELYPERCPCCGAKDITKYDRTEEHIQEDIIVPVTEATRFIRHYGYCRSCRKVFYPRGEDELLGSYIGPNAKAFAVYLKYKIKVSDRDIADLFLRTFGLKIDPSSIGGFRDQLARAGLPLYNELLKDLKKSSYINADETGWKLDGTNHWLWKFTNKKVSITHIDKSRGSKVVENILGKRYNGVLISDFLSAYNRIEAKAKQKCTCHLKRDLEKIQKRYSADSSILQYTERLKKLLDDAADLKKDYMDKIIGKKDYISRREELVDTLDDFSFPHPLKGTIVTLAKRLKKHKDSIFTFLYYTDVPSHNNHAEQQIRPDVIFRKITFGNRSSKGTKNHSILQSIIQTARLNGIDCPGILKEVLCGKDTQRKRLLNLIRSP